MLKEKCKSAKNQNYFILEIYFVIYDYYFTKKIRIAVVAMWIIVLFIIFSSLCLSNRMDASIDTIGISSLQLPLIIENEDLK